MSLRSVISKKYLLRLTAVGCVCLGFAAWSYYDGKYAWPEQRERALMFQQLEEEGRLEDWTAIASEKGWEAYDPGEPKTPEDIKLQFYMVGIAGIPGLLVLINVLRSLGRWVEMDDEGLVNSRGQRVAWDKITKIDKKKWAKKGICHVYYETDSGEKTFLLDDFIYERPTTDQILRDLEQKVGVDKIINGDPEPPPKSVEPAQPVEQSSSE